MKSEEVVDSVGMMRKIRDRMTAKMQEMSFEERKRYIEGRAKKIVEELSLQKLQGAA